MKRILNTVRRIAQLDTTVLISGESGVGKEVIANYIFNMSNRDDKPFVKINCAAIPDNLLESELFGYAKGAFTGAEMCIRDRGYTVPEAFDNEQLKVRNMVVEVDDKQIGRIKMPGVPIKM